MVPPIAYWVAYRMCRLGLQRSDRAVLEHGLETGIIKRLPHGEFIEVHQPLAGVDSHDHPIPLTYQGASVPKRMNQLGFGGAPVTYASLNFALLHVPGPGIASPLDFAYVEQYDDTRYLDERERVDAYERLWSHLQAAALNPVESTDFIAGVAA